MLGIARKKFVQIYFNKASQVIKLVMLGEGPLRYYLRIIIIFIQQR